jgi:WD40 repeat protein
VAVIVNEFGEVGIDNQLVIGADEEIFMMNNGCICCTVRGDLIRIIGTLLKRKDRFDYMVIETTGLADPASGNLDGSVHLFRTENEQNWHMSGYPMKVTSVRFDYNGLNLFTASGPALVSWNMKKFEGTGGRLFKGHLGWIREIACHPSRSSVATAGEDGLLCLWEPQTTKPLLSQEINKEGGLSSVAWSPKDQWLATGASDGGVSLFSVHGIEGRAWISSAGDGLFSRNKPIALKTGPERCSI